MCQLIKFVLHVLSPCRSNIAVMFLSDLVLDGLEIDWSAHLPLMLHIIFLGKNINFLFCTMKILKTHVKTT